MTDDGRERLIVISCQLLVDRSALRALPSPLRSLRYLMIELLILNIISKQSAQKNIDNSRLTIHDYRFPTVNYQLSLTPPRHTLPDPAERFRCDAQERGHHMLRYALGNGGTGLNQVFIPGFGRFAE